MSNNNSLEIVSGETLLKLVSNGDTSSLSGEQKLAYYRARCEAAGIDARTAPFQFIRLQGKEILYATKYATDRLASKNQIKLEVISQTTEQDIRVVMVRAISADGRQTDEIGAVSIGGIKGSDLANAYMKAITKAKRRAVLSLCGLGMLDETEIETIPGSETVQMPKRVSTPVDKIETKTPEVLISPIAQNSKTITFPQGKRFFAIAKGANKSDEEIKAYLASIGVAKTIEMPIEKYDAAGEWAGKKAVVVDTKTGEIETETPGVGE